MPRKKSENTAQVAIRLPQSCLDRCDVLIVRLAIPGMRMDRADVLRAALMRGLDALEAEKGIKPVLKAVSLGRGLKGR